VVLNFAKASENLSEEFPAIKSAFPIITQETYSFLTPALVPQVPPHIRQIPVTQTPQIPQTLHLPLATHSQYPMPPPTKVVSYQEIHNLLFKEPKLQYYSPKTSVLADYQPLTSHVTQSLLVDHASSIFTRQVFQPSRSIQPTQLMEPQHVTPAVPQVQTITLATPVQPYQVCPWELQKREGDGGRSKGDCGRVHIYLLM
jgi:hypothetical protein